MERIYETLSKIIKFISSVLTCRTFKSEDRSHMKFFQYGNPQIIIRGSFDNTDFWNIVHQVFKSKGYRLLQSYDGFGFGGAGCEYHSKSGNNFTFEHDGWDNITLYPDDPTNEFLLDELHQLADAIELIGSSNPDLQKYHVNNYNWPPRERIYK